MQRDRDKVRECTLFVTSFPSWAAKQDILLQFSFLSLIRAAFGTLPLMLSQHFHDKALFLRDFRNLALEGPLLGQNCSAPGVAVTSPPHGARGVGTPSRQGQQQRRPSPQALCTSSRAQARIRNVSPSGGRKCHRKHNAPISESPGHCGTRRFQLIWLGRPGRESCFPSNAICTT